MLTMIPTTDNQWSFSGNLGEDPHSLDTTTGERIVFADVAIDTLDRHCRPQGTLWVSVSAIGHVADALLRCVKGTRIAVICKVDEIKMVAGRAGPTARLRVTAASISPASRMAEDRRASDVGIGHSEAPPPLPAADTQLLQAVASVLREMLRVAHGAVPSATVADAGAHYGDVAVVRTVQHVAPHPISAGQLARVRELRTTLSREAAACDELIRTADPSVGYGYTSAACRQAFGGRGVKECTDVELEQRLRWLTTEWRPYLEARVHSSESTAASAGAEPAADTRIA